LGTVTAAAERWRSGAVPEGKMPDHKTYKLVEIVGTSAQSFSEAVSSGVARASKTLRNIDWFEVTELRGRVAKGKVAEYQVKLKVGFKLDD
jgi:dodecin